MSPSPSLKQAGTVGALLRRRLREVNRSAEELAEAVQVPIEYIDDLISGARRPPRPTRTDIYEKMTSFLRLGRNDLASCATAERAGDPSAAAPEVGVQRLLLDLCEPKTARMLEQRRARKGNAEMVDIIQRLLTVAQGVVRRQLDDQITLRLAANSRGTTYVQLRLNVLEFLDTTPDTLKPADLTDFVQPWIARWDVDLKTDVLRVALRAPEPRDRTRRGALLGGSSRPAATDHAPAEGLDTAVEKRARRQRGA